MDSGVLWRLDQEPLDAIQRSRLQYWAWAKALAEIDETAADQVRRSARESSSSLFGRLKLTIKDHKPQGSIGFRPIITSESHSFKGLSMWLHRVLLPEARRIRHLAMTTLDAK